VLRKALAGVIVGLSFEDVSIVGITSSSATSFSRRAVTGTLVSRLQFSGMSLGSSPSILSVISPQSTASSSSIDYLISVYADELGYTSAFEAYSAISMQLRDALKNGTYVVKLKSLAALMNVTALVNMSTSSISTQELLHPTAAPSAQSYSTGRPSRIAYISSVKNEWVIPTTVAIGCLIFAVIYYILLRLCEKYFCRQEHVPQPLDNANNGFSFGTVSPNGYVRGRDAGDPTSSRYDDIEQHFELVVSGGSFTPSGRHINVRSL
jgi:hypothetical protein